MRISDWSSDVCASDRGPSETAPMKVHAVLQTGEAATIGTGLAVELDGASIGQDQPRPGEQDAGLPGANLSVIVTDQPRALRDQQDEIGRAHVCTPVTNAHLVCRLMLAKKKKTSIK